MTCPIQPDVSKLELKPILQLKRERIAHEEEYEVSTLLNKHRYFLEDVFILKDNKNSTLPFRLLVFGANQLLIDQNYKTSRGAKIAFGNHSTSVGNGQKSFPKWSHFYFINASWFKTKLSKLKLNDMNKGGDMEGFLHE